MAAMTASVDERLAQTFVELADTLVAGFDLMEFLHNLTERCVELLDVDAAHREQGSRGDQPHQRHTAELHLRQAVVTMSTD